MPPTRSCSPTTTTLQAEFWRRMDTPAAPKDLVVQYGDNVEGSAFPVDSKAAWSLRTLPTEPPSILQHIQHVIPGVNSPMLYHGMLFASFCWHIEDSNLHSINYHHAGAPKVWYGVGAPNAERFEEFVRDEVRPPRLASPHAVCHHAGASCPHHEPVCLSC